MVTENGIQVNICVSFNFICIFRITKFGAGNYSLWDLVHASADSPWPVDFHRSEARRDLHFVFFFLLLFGCCVRYAVDKH